MMLFIVGMCSAMQILQSIDALIIIFLNYALHLTEMPVPRLVRPAYTGGLCSAVGLVWDDDDDFELNNLLIDHFISIFITLYFNYLGEITCILPLIKFIYFMFMCYITHIQRLYSSNSCTMDQVDIRANCDNHKHYRMYPLLYRCSLNCRLYTRFNTLHSKQHSVLRLDVFCQHLDFSVTDEQVPMLLRLFKLVLALYYGRINNEQPESAVTAKRFSHRGKIFFIITIYHSLQVMKRFTVMKMKKMMRLILILEENSLHLFHNMLFILILLLCYFVLNNVNMNLMAVLLKVTFHQIINAQLFYLELAETHAEMTQLIIDITKPQLYLLTNIYHSWFINHPDPSRLANTSLLSDVLSVTKENEIYLLHGPEEISGCHFTNFFSSNKSSVPHTVNQPSRSLPGMASSTNVKKFITFLLQLPIAPEDQSPVLYMSLLEIQAFTSILDPVLLKWLNYQPKLTAKGYSHIAMVSDAEQFLNYDSKFSSTASSAPTKSASQSISHATPCPLASADQTKSEKIEIVEETQEFEWSSYFSKYSLVLNKILIQVQMNASYILVPNHSLGSLAVQNNLSSAVKQAIISTRFSHADMLVINLPVINVFSNTIQRHNQAGELPSFPASIPVGKYIDGCLNVEQFPWTVKFSNFCVYTVHKNNLTHEAKYVINPLGFSSTVAVTTKFSNHSLSNKLTAYCIHADMEALHLNFCIKQVELISELGSFVTKFIPLLTKPPDLISTLSQSPVPSLLPKSSMTPIVPPLVNPLSSSSVYEISYVNSVTVKSTNEEENKTHKDELDQVFQEGSAENSVSLWLQWTIPKLCWNIFSSDGLSDEWLMFELEDLTTSFDIQEVYFKAKSKIGAFNITSLHKRLNEGECCPYIMEVDINMQPADIVIQPMTGISAALVFQPLVELIVDHLPYSSVPNEDFYPVGWGFNNKNVPLLHINSSTIRIFFLNQNLSGRVSTLMFKIISDMLMLQLDSIVITPRAENPISRNILLPKVYNKFKKLHHIPGSSVEDRQYQIDVSGISLSTGCWAEFLECGNIKKPDSSAIPVSMGENPALEWNTKGLVALQNNPDVIVCPLLSRFDVKVILVPAIVYTPEDSEQDRGSLKDTFIDDVTFNVSDSNDSLSSLPKYNSNNSAVSEDSEGLGYEGSDDSMSENEDNMPVYKKRLYPFMIINVLHPHSLIKCHPLMQHFEISCFDLNVRSAQGLLPISGRKMIPGSSDYKVNWIETAAGEPDAKTGVAACLFILSASDFLHQPGTVDIKIDRPVNLNVSLLKLEQLQTFLSKIQSVCTDNKYIEKKASGIVSEKYTKKLNTSEDFSIKLKRVTATTEQMVIVVETVPHIKNAHVVMSFTDLSSDLYMDFEGKGVQTLSTSIALDNFLLTTAIDNNKSQMIGPCTDLHVKISLDWSVMQNNAPIITTVLKGGTIPIKNQSEDEIKVEKYLQNSDAMKQTFNDDLRKGKFLYIQNLGIDHINGSPGPHEIVFNTEASDRHPASMCWTYPQPRYLTKVEIYPLPFYSSNNENNQICCCLQYWDSLRERFLNFKKFIIQEATHCSVELYGEGNAEFSHKTPFSTTWRVQLDVSDVKSTIPNLPQLSPLSLAACMQVDSCYDPHHIPHLQFSICTELIYCTLYNSYNIKDIPNELQPFEFDDSMPKCQEIGVISVNGFSLLFQNRSTFKIPSTDFSIKIMDYLNLSMINLLDSCTAEGSYFKKKELNQPTVQECEVLMHPMFIHIGRAALHCISLCLKVIPTYYVICNNTCEFIKFGQVNTDEAIRLESLKMQCYSWRSLRSSEWSEGFSLCHQCKIVQTLKFGKTNEVYLIVDIKKLSETLTQIIINGQIIVSSRFSQHLELLMSKHSDPEMNKKRSKPVSHIIGQKKAIPSFVIHPSDIKHFRVRLMGQSNPWSSEIILKTCHALIQLPLKDSQKFISVWLTVFKENINNIPQYLILFTPLYILRSHLPQSLKLFINTPSINESCEIDVCSQGHEHDIVIESINSEISHQLNFQIGDGNKLSSPSVPLSPGMVDQITTPNDSIQDIDNMLKDCISTHPLKWPYCQIKDLDSALMNLTERNIEKLLSAKDINKYNSAPVHPNIELQVQLSQRWTCCKTLLIDVKPLMLFVNKSGLDLVLLLCEDDGSQNSWLIPAGTVFTPPKLKGSFRVGIQKEKKLFLSDPLQMSCEETSNLKTYWPNKIKGLIPTSGYTNISIDVTNQNKLNYLCQLSIQTVIKEGIQILSIHQLYSFCNKSDCDLQVATACYPAVSSKVRLNSCYKYSWDNSTKCALLGTKTSIVGSSQDIVYWFSGSEIVNSQTEFISFLSARHIDPSSGESSNWSVPISLPSFKGSNSDTKASLVIPMLCKVKPLALTNSLKSYVLTSHVKDGICFMIVQNDKYPSMIISNFCNFNLHFGQNSSGDSFGTTVIEEKDALDCVPFIPPNMSYPYTLPQACTEFPNISNQNTQAVRKLNLCLRSVSETSHCINSWSSSVTTNDVNDQFVTITGGCDTRIIKQVIGNTLYMHIYPIHRAQILAKDVRSKITASASCTSSILATRYSTQASPPLPDEKDVPIQVSNTSLIEESPEHKPEKSKVKKMLHRRTPSKQIQLITDNDRHLNFVSILFKHVCVILVDEKLFQHTEAIRVSLDDMCFILRPLNTTIDHFSLTNSISQKYKLFLSSRGLQVDNQLLDQGFDFPVVLKAQDEIKDKDFTLDNMLQLASKSSLINIELQLVICDETISFQTVQFASKPLSIYFEDKFLYKILDIIKILSPKIMQSQSISQVNTFCDPATCIIPMDLLLESSVISCPIRIQELVIKPLKVMFSVHASVKLYLSIDHTPLSFKVYERKDLFTSSYALGRDFTMHYMSGALFRAGWAVASMDLLGNPAGFVRSVGTGISHFVQLPYRGLILGPWSFVIGMSHGSASLIRHIASGTLMSVTNLASSVSRNMDRLSLDSDHVSHQEQLRQQHPVGLTDGLALGLNGLGYSLLGAVAGLVDKPMQNVINNESTIHAVSGVVSGLSQGMLGIVTKPIGGAAELVAQAGQVYIQPSMKKFGKSRNSKQLVPILLDKQFGAVMFTDSLVINLCIPGLLHGAGWSKVLKRRYKPFTTDLVTISSNSSLKYSWKMMGLLTSQDVIYSIDSTHINHVGMYVSCSIILTSQLLVKATYLLVTIQLESQGNSHVPDRIAEFVTKQDLTTDQPDMDEDDNNTSSTENKTKFCVHPKHRHTFLTLFTIAQKQLFSKDDIMLQKSINESQIRIRWLIVYLVTTSKLTPFCNTLGLGASCNRASICDSIRVSNGKVQPTRKKVAFFLKMRYCASIVIQDRFKLRISRSSSKHLYYGSLFPI
ncbi:Vacuolar protein sorting-associated protein 13B [Nymphon striatum]|nr:Vacuolar protein sorting-associated protein 13B [Nymphon striatum]